MNILTDWDAVCSAVAAHMIEAPRKTVGRRPKKSDAYGANGYAASEPIFYPKISRKPFPERHWRGIPG